MLLYRSIKKRLLTVTLLLVSLIVSAPGSTSPQDSNTKDTTISAEPSKPTIYIIPVEGPVEHSMAARIGRGVHEADEAGASLIILEMNTFGGMLDPAWSISDTLMNATDIPTVAYVTKKAISAGALIALSCNRLYMRNGTTIGDCAPIMQSQEGPKMLGEKVQSPLRAKFRTLAKKNNYPEKLTEAMVSMDITVFEIITATDTFFIDSTEYGDMTETEREKILKKKTVVSKGELLTIDDVEAKELRFSQQSTANLQEVIEAEGFDQAEIVRLKETWSEGFVKLIGTLAPVLIIIGFAGVYIETKTPGFGVFGIVGLLCLALVYFGQYAVGLAAYTELLLLIIGLLLLAAEVFIIPGFGLAGILGILFLAAGTLLSMQDFVIPRPEFPWEQEILMRNIRMLVFTLCGSTILIMLFFKYLFPHISSVIQGPRLDTVLQSTLGQKEGAQEFSRGQTGITVKPLRPAGSVKFGNKIADVVSDGDFIGINENVKIVEFSGNRIVVRRSTEKNA